MNNISVHCRPVISERSLVRSRCIDSSDLRTYIELSDDFRIYSKHDEELFVIEEMLIRSPSTVLPISLTTPIRKHKTTVKVLVVTLDFTGLSLFGSTIHNNFLPKK